MKFWPSLRYLAFHFEYRMERAEGDGCERLSPSPNEKTAGSSDPGYTPWLHTFLSFLACAQQTPKTNISCCMVVFRNGGT